MTQCKINITNRDSTNMILAIPMYRQTNNKQPTKNVEAALTCMEQMDK